jgi:hypothetical protein
MGNYTGSELFDAVAGHQYMTAGSVVISGNWHRLQLLAIEWSRMQEQS